MRLTTCLKMSTSLSENLLKNKFRGCLLGALLGDCLGAPFEAESCVDLSELREHFEGLETPDVKGPVQRYTDDTAMTKSVAKCLIEKPEIDYQYLAKLFVTEYFKEPDRGYGANVIEVFRKLRDTKYADVFKPAKEQFDGSGSYGNGAAMRIAPIALYFYKNYENMVNAAVRSSMITHSNVLGVNGAVLQCIAVHQALVHKSDEDIDGVKFCEVLKEKMKQVEDGNLVGSEQQDHPSMYQTKIESIARILQTEYEDEEVEEQEDVIENLGNSISAHNSVPTAIFCFLRSLRGDIPGIKTDNIFRRTVQYAISLGGDTDTIASMAGAIAGAYLGADHINENLIERCEFHSEMTQMADDLYNIVVK